MMITRGSGNNCHQELCSYADYASDISFGCSSKASNGMGSQDTNQDAKVGTMAWIEKSVSSERGALPPRNDISAFKDHLIVRVLRRPVIRPDVQLLRLAIVAEGGD
jgi:hypothetical protein